MSYDYGTMQLHRIATTKPMSGCVDKWMHQEQQHENGKVFLTEFIAKMSNWSHNFFAAKLNESILMDIYIFTVEPIFE